MKKSRFLSLVLTLSVLAALFLPVSASALEEPALNCTHAVLLDANYNVLHKGRLIPVHRLRQDLGRLVGRGEQQAVQQLLHRQHLSRLDIGGGAPFRDLGGRGGQVPG